MFEYTLKIDFMLDFMLDFMPLVYVQTVKFP